MNPRGAQRGFIAPLAIVVVALLALGAVVAIGVLGDTRADLRAARERMRLEPVAASAASRAAFLLLTEPLGPGALRVGGDRTLAPAEAPNALPGRITAASGRRSIDAPIDGAAFLMRRGLEEAVIVRLQDAAGLINLNSEQEPALARLLMLEGVRGPDASYLAATLADYVDADDIRRANGAEADAYARARASAPPNRPLSAARLALNALGWRDAFTEPAADRFFTLADARPRGQGLNVNTAPPAVLRAVLGLDARATAQVLDARAQQPFTTRDAITERTGVALNADDYPLATAPAKVLRVSIRFAANATDPGYSQDYWLSLTPAGADRPFAWRSGGLARRPGEERRPLNELPEGQALLVARER